MANYNYLNYHYQKNNMKILITGINGFVGSHMAEYCLSVGDTVYGTLKSRNSDFRNIIKFKDKLILHDCELKDAKNVLDVIDSVRPDIIFHLAAQSFVPASWSSPSDTIVNNVVSEVNIFEAIRRLKISPVIHLACSSEEYGEVKTGEIPIRETNPLRPMSPYGVSKVAQEMLGQQYVRSYGLKVVITRAFNHEGPRRGRQFVTASFASQIARAIEGGKIMVGNLEAIRDFTDVRDVVKAYYIAATNKGIVYGEPYNVCTGTGWTIDKVLNALIDISGKKLTIEQDPDRMRPSDVPVLIGNFEKFYSVTGWEPTTPFSKTLADLYEYELLR